MRKWKWWIVTLKKENLKWHFLKKNYLCVNISTGEIGVMEMLFANGVEINARISSSNSTILHEICRNSIVFLLFKNRPLTNSDTDNLLRKLPFEFLIKNGANVNAKNSQGYTPLNWCILHSKYCWNIIIIKCKIPCILFVGRKMLTEMLLNSGADINIAENNGHTPLFIAFANFGSYGYDDGWASKTLTNIW